MYFLDENGKDYGLMFRDYTQVLNYMVNECKETAWIGFSSDIYNVTIPGNRLTQNDVKKFIKEGK